MKPLTTGLALAFSLALPALAGADAVTQTCAGARAPMNGAESEAAGTIEIVHFRLAPGQTDEAFLAAAADSAAFLCAQPGFIARSLLKGGGGEWIDLVEWRDRDAALAAAAKAMQVPALAGFFAAINESSITMHHAENLYRLKRR